MCMCMKSKECSCFMIHSLKDAIIVIACYEGLCATSVITQYGKQPTQQSTGLRRNQSFNVKRAVSVPEKSKTGRSMNMVLCVNM